MANTKSAAVRGFIMESKQAGNKVIVEALIRRTMSECNFQRQLARAYLKNNWGRVTLKLTLEEALATVPLRDKGRFVSKAVRLAQAQALVAAQ